MGNVLKNYTILAVSDTAPAEASEALAIPDERLDVFLAYDVEMDAQDDKWGSQRQLTDEKWLAILAEEFGEAAKEVCEHDEDRLLEELIQCGAVVSQWIAALQTRKREV